MRFFVTGGSRGIGAQLVRDLTAAGHDVAFTYRERAAEAEAVLSSCAAAGHPGRCRAYRLDVRDPAAVEAVADQAAADLGPAHAVVNNAAISRPGMAALMTDEDWQAVIDTNLSGAFFVSRQFLAAFLGEGRGRFIHIASVAAHGMAGQVNYCASKAGLLGLSAALAKEYGRRGITSNALVLGLFETDMSRAALDSALGRHWLEACPAGRCGRLDEVSHAVLFLASDAAGFINGEAIHLSGGLDRVP